jgi:hypothetical protein
MMARRPLTSSAARGVNSDSSCPTNLFIAKHI